MENDLHREMPMDHVISLFVEAQLKAWKQVHLVCRDDRQHDNVVSFTAQALDTWVQDVATDPRSSAARSEGESHGRPPAIRSTPRL
jgi:hypothetical protein